ncbi:DUF4194 domain-containing protein [Nocardioides sp. BGMRC 2183]|nr:DUF4194 domain-containing protein [Nocardioides sp. BGMRC 2183]
MTEQDTRAKPTLWTGDLGTLQEQSRRALLEIVKGPYLSGARRPQLWAALLADEDSIRAQLHNLFLDLVLDPVDEFAFVRKVRTTELDVPSPLRTESLTFLDTAMLLVLRQLMLAAPGEQRVIVGQSEIYERLDVYRTGDRSTFARNLNAAWNRMLNKFRVLHSVGEDRAEISPVVKFLLDHDLVVALTGEYRRIAGDDTGEGTDGDDAQADPRSE